MTWLRIALAALCVGSAVQAAAPSGTTAETLSARWMTAYNSGDLDALIAIYAADARVQHGYCTAVHGREAIAKFWTGDFEEGSQTKLIVVDSFEVDEVVYVSGHYAVMDAENASAEAPIGGNFTQIWRRTDSAEWALYRESWINLACARASEHEESDETHGDSIAL